MTMDAAKLNSVLLFCFLSQLWNVNKNRINKTATAAMNPVRKRGSAAIACGIT
jgi:hypothetical protein